MEGKIYKPSKFRRVVDLAFRGSIIFSICLTAGATAYTLYRVGKFYIYEKPALTRQQKEYAEALLRKEKREKELGLRY
ncbi:hypothetical protein X801_09013 [Opisthorchis viverrini]|uniref:Cytochrome c oxidase assembly protein COX16 homolog, mitochondrial n=1 Tax=Opisthorchis viverrini TaxID=6198 RepID=A0A1S8WL81_OPIVI|nr:hypothetical protein X801_09013 [Opisthorchis viverrini]